jgi:Xaa-Pro aminopeptidase
MIKTAEELVKLRENFALTDLGQAAARQAVQVGKREIDIWTAIHTAVEQAAGHRVPLGNDCVVGYRQANIGGWPLHYEIRPHDSVIVDLSTILHGYWSDGCGTYYANEPTPQQVALHRTVSEVLELAISLVRPGVVAKEIDQKVRQFIAGAGYPVYPHHTGHGVGVSGHEAPRIVPYSDEVLEEGMVIMLEPGIYLPGETGVRLEDGFLITSDGVEMLTKFDKRLP